MAEYIKREEAKKAILKACGCDYRCMAGTWCNGECEIHAGSVLGAVDNIPAADVVKVVRCKDCKYADEIEDNYCKCENTGAGMSINGFCSDGERREENENCNN